jgi:PPOX class probable F420-dependent enzyme
MADPTPQPAAAGPVPGPKADPNSAAPVAEAGTAPAPPRASAHPVPGRRLPAALFGARLAARTAPRGAREIDGVPRTGSPREIPPSKRSLLVTYRRDGTPVATPVWAAPGDDGRFYVRTERTAGKVKRLRNDARVLIAPCTVRGRPLGAPFEAHARVLAAGAEQARGERALARRYGLGRELFERAMDILRVDMCYLEISPGAWG